MEWEKLKKREELQEMQRHIQKLREEKELKQQEEKGSSRSTSAWQRSVRRKRRSPGSFIRKSSAIGISSRCAWASPPTM